MTKEKVKQWIRNQIDSCIKTQHENNDKLFFLLYNKSYVRALKLSTITGQPVNKENFNGGETLFGFDTITKRVWYYPKIQNYLKENYSIVQEDRLKLVNEVINEYEEYKDYKSWG